MVNVQPSDRTVAVFIESAMEPPSLVLYDGTATVFFTPASMPGGVQAAAVFARELAGAVAQWEQGCARAAALVESADPLGVADVVIALDTETG